MRINHIVHHGMGTNDVPAAVSSLLGVVLGILQSLQQVENAAVRLTQSRRPRTDCASPHYHAQCVQIESNTFCRRGREDDIVQLSAR